MKWHTKALWMAGLLAFTLPGLGQANEDMELTNKTLRLNQIQVFGSHNSYKKAIAPALLDVIRADNPKSARLRKNLSVNWFILHRRFSRSRRCSY